MVVLPNQRELLEKRLMELDAQLSNLNAAESHSPVIERTDLRIRLCREYLELSNKLQDLKIALRHESVLGEQTSSRAPASSSAGNRLLASLGALERQGLLARMQHVELRFKQVLHKYHEPIEYVFFPNRGTVSALATMDDGSAIEIAQVGNEGLVGMSALLSLDVSPVEVIVQIPGDGWRMSASELRQEISRGGAVRQLLMRYHAAQMIQISQSVACNGLHSVHQRCCRWLLMTQDRMESDTFPLTHEFLGIMLGVRRSSVSTVLQPLSRKGLIDNQRGQITILDRRGLEHEACECYQKVKDDFDRLLGARDQ